MSIPVALNPACGGIVIIIFTLTALLGPQSYLIMLLICISLMVSDAEHIFMCLFAICISSLVLSLYIFGPFSNCPYNLSSSHANDFQLVYSLSYVTTTINFRSFYHPLNKPFLIIFLFTFPLNTPFPHFKPRPTLNLLPALTDFLFLHISQKWAQTVCGCV